MFAEESTPAPVLFDFFDADNRCTAGADFAVRAELRHIQHHFDLIA
jgi:hypothetical protein